jgi:calnexin
MQNDILFDNIYVGHSIEDADALKKETFDVKIVGEKAEENAALPKFDDKKTDDEPLDFKKDPVKFVKQKVEAFIAVAKKDPLEAAKTMPEVAGPIGLVLLTIVALIMTALSPAAPTKEQIKKAKGAAEKAKDDATAALATGAEKTKDSVSKRATRSSEKS